MVGITEGRKPVLRQLALDGEGALQLLRHQLQGVGLEGVPLGHEHYLQSAGLPDPSRPPPRLPHDVHALVGLEPLDSRAEEEKDQGAITDSAATVGKPKPASPRQPTFLQRERWKAIQKARRKGLSLRAIERELGIHRAPIKKYLDAEGPPTRHDLAAPATSSSDTMAT